MIAKWSDLGGNSIIWIPQCVCNEFIVPEMLTWINCPPKGKMCTMVSEPNYGYKQHITHTYVAYLFIAVIEEVILGCFLVVGHGSDKTYTAKM